MGRSTDRLVLEPYLKWFSMYERRKYYSAKFEALRKLLYSLRDAPVLQLFSCLGLIPMYERPNAASSTDQVPHGGFIKSLQTSPLWKDPFRNPNVFLYLKVTFVAVLLA